MAKRWTDTNLWKNQRWFRKLPPVYKLVFCYIKDQCDHAGIWKIDCSDLMEDLGLDEFDLDDFVDKVNTDYDKQKGAKIRKERIVILRGVVLWITGFIQFQYENKERVVPIAVPAVRTACCILHSYGFFEEGLRKGYIRVAKGLSEKYLSLNDNCQTLIEDLKNGLLTVKDKDKDKDKKKGGAGENNLQPISINGREHKPEKFGDRVVWKTIKGFEFDKELTKVHLVDDTWQDLGDDQRSRLKDRNLKPSDVFKGYIA